MTTVELVQAFLWTCDECGRDNFERAITVAPEALNADDIRELEQFFEFDEKFVATQAPTEVVCGHCGSRFSTEEPDSG